MPRAYFTLDDAQALLPRFSRLLGTALQLHAHLRKAIAELGGDDGPISFGVLRGEEPLQSRDAEDLIALERARLLYQALRERVEEIERTGAEVKGVVEGLVDFRSWLDGHTEVLLCWKLGETGITHFHEIETGFSARRPVAGHWFSRERQEPEMLAEQAPSDEAS